MAEDFKKLWTQESQTYKQALNDWLDVIYLKQENPSEPEPKDPRAKLSETVRDAIIAASKDGEDLSTILPPDIDPLAEVIKEVADPVNRIMVLPDESIICQVSGDKNTVYQLAGNKCEEVTGIVGLGFGSCTSKKYFAKCLNDRIEICEGWFGPLITTLSYPNGYSAELNQKFPEINFPKSASDWGISAVQVTADGKAVVLTTPAGIFYIDKTSNQLLHPTAEQVEGDIKEHELAGPLSLDYEHADLSPDDEYICVGSQMSNHIIFSRTDEGWQKLTEIEPRSSYPNVAKFNYKLENKHLAMSSCHFARSGTIGIALDKLSDSFSASGYDADESLDYLDDQLWIFAILPSRLGYILGGQSGYTWVIGLPVKGYIHTGGGTVTSMDLSADGTKLYIANYSGQIVCLEWDTTHELDWEKNNRVDDNLITNLPVREMKRYLFWKGHEPLVW